MLSGIVELTPEGGEPVIYKAGDSFVMKPGSAFGRPSKPCARST
ncbi:cupin domain-containing protein [Streptomyces swartbergensis]